MKTNLLILATLVGVGSFAQSIDISSAKIALDKNQLAEAKTYIDNAKAVIDEKGTGDVSEKNMSKYYWYRGDIYFKLYATEKENRDVYLKEAAQAYMDLISYEKSHKERYAEYAVANLPSVASGFVDFAGDYYDNKDYQGASNAYTQAIDIRKFMGITDTIDMYNRSFLSVQLEKYDVAEKELRELIKMGYKGISWTAVITDEESAQNGQRLQFPSKAILDEYIAQNKAKDPEKSASIEPQLYQQLIYVLKKSEKQAEYEATLKEARAKFPQDENLLTLELQVYLDKKDYDGALNNLHQAVTKNPNDKSNALYYYNMGYIYDQEKKDRVKAEEFYNKAISVDSMYSDPIYMMGLMKIQESNEIVEQMNSLKRNETKKFNELDKEKDKKLAEALKYFEQAYKVKPKDEDTLKALKEVYYKLGKYEDVKRVTAELQNL